MSWISLSRHSLFRHTIQALHTDVFNVKCILPQTKKTKKNMKNVVETLEIGDSNIGVTAEN